MSSRIRDLWSDAISPDVLTPLAILRAQVPGLERRTKGLIEAEVNTVVADKKTTHNFDLVAPALDQYRERILIVTHERERVYPATLEAAYFARKNGRSQVTAMYEEDFISLIGEVLTSPDVISSI